MNDGFPVDEQPPPVPPPRPYPSFLSALGMTLLILVATGLFGGVYALWVFIIDGIVGPEYALYDLLFPYVVLGNVVVFLIFILYGWWRSQLPFAEAYALRRASFMAYVLLIPATWGLQITLSELDNLTRRLLPLPDVMSEVMEMFGEHALLMGFTLVVVAPLTEEFIFRGLMLRGFLQRYRPWTAIVASAFLFSLLHVNPTQLLPTFIIGLFYGWFFLKAPSLWPLVFAHALHNGTVFILTVFPVIEIEGYNVGEVEPGTHQPLWFTATGIVVLIISLAAIHAWGRERRNVQPAEASKANWTGPT